MPRKIKAKKQHPQAPAGVSQADMDALAEALAGDPSFQSAMKEAVRQLQAGRPFEQVLETVIYKAARTSAPAQAVEARIVAKTAASTEVATEVATESKEETEMTETKSKFVIVTNSNASAAATPSIVVDRKPPVRPIPVAAADPIEEVVEAPVVVEKVAPAPLTKEDVAKAVSKAVAVTSKTAHIAAKEIHKVVNKENAEKVGRVVAKTSIATGKGLLAFARLVGSAAKEGWNEAK